MHASSVAFFLVCWLAIASGMFFSSNSFRNCGQFFLKIHQFASAGSHVVTSADGYVVAISQEMVNGRRIANLKITGNGIYKNVDYPCDSAPWSIDIVNGVLVVGDEWYSDRPKFLVHVVGEQCLEEVFTEENGQISTCEPVILGQQECAGIRAKMYNMN